MYVIGHFFCKHCFDVPTQKEYVSNLHYFFLNTGYLYLMTDIPFQVTCCGATSAWAFFAKDYGIVEMMIFRKSSAPNYRLIGSTRIIVPGGIIRRQ